MDHNDTHDLPDQVTNATANLHAMIGADPSPPSTSLAYLAHNQVFEQDAVNTIKDLLHGHLGEEPFRTSGCDDKQNTTLNTDSTKPSTSLTARNISHEAVSNIPANTYHEDPATLKARAVNRILFDISYHAQNLQPPVQPFLKTVQLIDDSCFDAHAHTQDSVNTSSAPTPPTDGEELVPSPPVPAGSATEATYDVVGSTYAGLGSGKEPLGMDIAIQATQDAGAVRDGVNVGSVWGNDMVDADTTHIEVGTDPSPRQTDHSVCVQIRAPVAPQLSPHTSVSGVAGMSTAVDPHTHDDPSLVAPAAVVDCVQVAASADMTVNADLAATDSVLAMDSAVGEDAAAANDSPADTMPVATGVLTASAGMTNGLDEPRTTHAQGAVPTLNVTVVPGAHVPKEAHADAAAVDAMEAVVVDTSCERAHAAAPLEIVPRATDAVVKASTEAMEDVSTVAPVAVEVAVKTSAGLTAVSTEDAESDAGDAMHKDASADVIMNISDAVELQAASSVVPVADEEIEPAPANTNVTLAAPATTPRRVAASATRTKTAPAPTPIPAPTSAADEVGVALGRSRRRSGKGGSRAYNPDDFLALELDPAERKRRNALVSTFSEDALYNRRPEDTVGDAAGYSDDSMYSKRRRDHASASSDGSTRGPVLYHPQLGYYDAHTHAPLASPQITTRAASKGKSRSTAKAHSPSPASAAPTASAVDVTVPVAMPMASVRSTRSSTRATSLPTANTSATSEETAAVPRRAHWINSGDDMASIAPTTPSRSRPSRVQKPPHTHSSDANDATHSNSHGEHAAHAPDALAAPFSPSSATASPAENLACSRSRRPLKRKSLAADLTPLSDHPQNVHIGAPASLAHLIRYDEVDTSRARRSDDGRQDRDKDKKAKGKAVGETGASTSTTGNALAASAAVAAPTNTDMSDGEHAAALGEVQTSDTSAIPMEPVVDHTDTGVFSPVPCNDATADPTATNTNMTAVAADVVYGGLDSAAALVNAGATISASNDIYVHPAASSASSTASLPLRTPRGKGKGKGVTFSAMSRVRAFSSNGADTSVRDEYKIPTGSDEDRAGVVAEDEAVGVVGVVGGVEGEVGAACGMGNVFSATETNTYSFAPASVPGHATQYSAADTASTAVATAGSVAVAEQPDIANASVTHVPQVSVQSSVPAPTAGVSLPPLHVAALSPAHPHTCIAPPTPLAAHTNTPTCVAAASFSFVGDAISAAAGTATSEASAAVSAGAEVRVPVAVPTHRPASATSTAAPPVDAHAHASPSSSVSSLASLARVPSAHMPLPASPSFPLSSLSSFSSFSSASAAPSAAAALSPSCPTPSSTRSARRSLPSPSPSSPSSFPHLRSRSQSSATAHTPFYTSLPPPIPPPSAYTPSVLPHYPLYVTCATPSTAPRALNLGTVPAIPGSSVSRASVTAPGASLAYGAQYHTMNAHLQQQLQAQASTLQAHGQMQCYTAQQQGNYTPLSSGNSETTPGFFPSSGTSRSSYKEQPTPTLSAFPLSPLSLTTSLSTPRNSLAEHSLPSPLYPHNTSPSSSACSSSSFGPAGDITPMQLENNNGKNTPTPIFSQAPGTPTALLSPSTPLPDATAPTHTPGSSGRGRAGERHRSKSMTPLPLPAQHTPPLCAVDGKMDDNPLTLDDGPSGMNDSNAAMTGSISAGGHDAAPLRPCSSSSAGSLTTHAHSGSALAGGAAGAGTGGKCYEKPQGKPPARGMVVCRGRTTNRYRETIKLSRKKKSGPNTSANFGPSAFSNPNVEATWDPSEDEPRDIVLPNMTSVSPLSANIDEWKRQEREGKFLLQLLSVVHARWARADALADIEDARAVLQEAGQRAREAAEAVSEAEQYAKTVLYGANTPAPTPTATIAAAGAAGAQPIAALPVPASLPMTDSDATLPPTHDLAHTVVAPADARASTAVVGVSTGVCAASTPFASALPPRPSPPALTTSSSSTSSKKLDTKPKTIDTFPLVVSARGRAVDAIQQLRRAQEQLGAAVVRERECAVWVRCSEQAFGGALKGMIGQAELDSGATETASCGLAGVWGDGAENTGSAGATGVDVGAATDAVKLEVAAETEGVYTQLKQEPSSSALLPLPFSSTTVTAPASLPTLAHTPSLSTPSLAHIAAILASPPLTSTLAAGHATHAGVAASMGMGMGATGSVVSDGCGAYMCEYHPLLSSTASQRSSASPTHTAAHTHALEEEEDDEEEDTSDEHYMRMHIETEQVLTATWEAVLVRYGAGQTVKKKTPSNAHGNSGQPVTGGTAAIPATPFKVEQSGKNNLGKGKSGKYNSGKNQSSHPVGESCSILASVSPPPTLSPTLSTIPHPPLPPFPPLTPLPASTPSAHRTLSSHTPLHFSSPPPPLRSLSHPHGHPPLSTPSSIRSLSRAVLEERDLRSFVETLIAEGAAEEVERRAREVYVMGEHDGAATKRENSEEGMSDVISHVSAPAFTHTMSLAPSTLSSATCSSATTPTTGSSLANTSGANSSSASSPTHITVGGMTIACPSVSAPWTVPRIHWNYTPAPPSEPFTLPMHTYVRPADAPLPYVAQVLLCSPQALGLIHHAHYVAVNATRKRKSFSGKGGATPVMGVSGLFGEEEGKKERAKKMRKTPAVKEESRGRRGKKEDADVSSAATASAGALGMGMGMGMGATTGVTPVAAAAAMMGMGMGMVAGSASPATAMMGGAAMGTGIPMGYGYYPYAYGTGATTAPGTAGAASPAAMQTGQATVPVQSGMGVGVDASSMSATGVTAQAMGMTAMGMGNITPEQMQMLQMQWLMMYQQQCHAQTLAAQSAATTTSAPASVGSTSSGSGNGSGVSVRASSATTISITLNRPLSATNTNTSTTVSQTSNANPAARFTTDSAPAKANANATASGSANTDAAGPTLVASNEPSDAHNSPTIGAAQASVPPADNASALPTTTTTATAEGAPTAAQDATVTTTSAVGVAGGSQGMSGNAGAGPGTGVIDAQTAMQMQMQMQWYLMYQQQLAANTSATSNGAVSADATTGAWAVAPGQTAPTMSPQQILQYQQYQHYAACMYAQQAQQQQLMLMQHQGTMAGAGVGATTGAAGQTLPMVAYPASVTQHNYANNTNNTNSSITTGLTVQIPRAGSQVAVACAAPAGESLTSQDGSEGGKDGC